MSLTLIEPVAFGLLRRKSELALYEQFTAMRDAYFQAFKNGEKEAALQVVDYLGGEGSFDALPSRIAGTYCQDDCDPGSGHAFEIRSTIVRFRQHPAPNPCHKR